MGAEPPEPRGRGQPSTRRPCARRLPASQDNSLLHAIETIVIDWSHQIRDVLSKDSAQALLDGLHPLPRVEFEFWDARLTNLKCIYDQVTPPLRCGDPALGGRTARTPSSSTGQPSASVLTPGAPGGPGSPGLPPQLLPAAGSDGGGWGLRVPAEKLSSSRPLPLSAEQAQGEQDRRGLGKSQKLLLAGPAKRVHERQRRWAADPPRAVGAFGGRGGPQGTQPAPHAERLPGPRPLKKPPCLEGSGSPSGAQSRGAGARCPADAPPTVSLPRAGLKEAEDIVLYLTPLRVLLEEMEQADFMAVRPRAGAGCWPGPRSRPGLPLLWGRPLPELWGQASRGVTAEHRPPPLRSSPPSSPRRSTPSAWSGPPPSTTTHPPGSSSSCRSSATRSSSW